jgi:hypothetical protein
MDLTKRATTRQAGAIVIAAALRGPLRPDLFWQRYLWRAWRRGRRTRPLPMADYEALLPLPIDEVRRRLRIEPAERAHPGGILVFPAPGPASGMAHGQPPAPMHG